MSLKINQPTLTPATIRPTEGAAATGSAAS